MSCTPKIRLSEDILAKSILKFYTSNQLVPAGIGTSALEDWSEKMSLGAVKVTRKFRRLFLETPTNAKNKVLKELKLRCVNAGISPEESVSSADSQSSRAASHEDLEELAVTPPPAFDWDALAKKVLQLKEKECPATTATAQGKPVATPCRSDQQVPAFVLDMMKQKTGAVKPFPTTSGEDDEIAIENDKPSQAKGASAKGKASKQKPSKSQASKKKKKEITGPEVETALKPHDAAPVPALETSPVMADQDKVDEVTQTIQEDVASCGYQPKKFSAARKDFMAEKKKLGLSHRQANDAWMSSNERATFLEGMPESELKRRRFL